MFLNVLIFASFCLSILLSLLEIGKPTAIHLLTSFMCFFFQLQLFGDLGIVNFLHFLLQVLVYVLDTILKLRNCFLFGCCLGHRRRHAFVHLVASSSCLIRKLLVKIPGLQVVVDVDAGVPAMLSLILTLSKHISIGESTVPRPTFKTCSSVVIFAGLSSALLLLRQDRFALIVKLLVLKSWSESCCCIVKLIWLLDRRFQL